MVLSGQPSPLKKAGHPVSFLKNGQPAPTALAFTVQPLPFFKKGHADLVVRIGHCASFL
jgi:hypothetical protein